MRFCGGADTLLVPVGGRVGEVSDGWASASLGAFGAVIVAASYFGLPSNWEILKKNLLWARKRGEMVAGMDAVAAAVNRLDGPTSKGKRFV